MAFAKTRAALEDVGAEKAALDTELHKLRDQLADTAARLQSSQGHNDRLVRELDALQRERDQLRAAAAHGEALAKRLDDAAVRAQAVVQERDRLADTVRWLTEALRQKDDRCSELEEKLKARRAVPRVPCDCAPWCSCPCPGSDAAARPRRSADDLRRAHDDRRAAQAADLRAAEQAAGASGHRGEVRGGAPAKPSGGCALGVGRARPDRGCRRPPAGAFCQGCPGNALFDAHGWEALTCSVAISTLTRCSPTTVLMHHPSPAQELMRLRQRVAEAQAEKESLKREQQGARASWPLLQTTPPRLCLHSLTFHALMKRLRVLLRG